MWASNGLEMVMTEGDFGIQIPITIHDVTFSANDELQLTIKKKRNGDTIITKTYENITNNTIQLELTEEESALLPTGLYIYVLDWYQDGAFLCNLVPSSIFKVVDKG